MLVLRASLARTPDGSALASEAEGDGAGPPAPLGAALSDSQLFVSFVFLEESGEEVVALVVDDDKGGEVLDLDLPDGLHAELRIL